MGSSGMPDRYEIGNCGKQCTDPSHCGKAREVFQRIVFLEPEAGSLVIITDGNGYGEREQSRRIRPGARCFVSAHS